jgi:hypothetical protein
MASPGERTAVVRNACTTWDEGDAAGFETVPAEDVAHPSHEVDAMVAEGDWVATPFPSPGPTRASSGASTPRGRRSGSTVPRWSASRTGGPVERPLVEPLLDVHLELGAVEYSTR